MSVTTDIRSDNVVDAIIATAQDARAAMIVMGASGGVVVDDWPNSNVMGQCDIPVAVISHDVSQ